MELHVSRKNILKPVLERFDVPTEDRKYWITSTISGIWAIIQAWINIQKIF